MHFLSVVAFGILLYLSFYAPENEAQNTQQMQVSSRVLTSLCEQRRQFQESKTLQPPVKTSSPDLQDVPCTWFYLCKHSGRELCETPFTTCAETGPLKRGRTVKQDFVDLAGARAKPTAKEIGENLEKATTAVNSNLEGFKSGDSVKFIGSLLNVAGVFNPWVAGFAAVFGIVTSVFTESKPDDKLIIKDALAKVSKSLKELEDKVSEIEQEVGDVLVLQEFKDIRYSINDIVAAYNIYGLDPTELSREEFVKTCDSKFNGKSQANWLYREITGKDDAIPRQPVEPRLINYFKKSCNYTELIYLGMEITATYFEAAQVFSFCYGVTLRNVSDEERNNSVTIRAELFDRQWKGFAGSLYEVLIKAGQLSNRNCRDGFLALVENFTLSNQGLPNLNFTKQLVTTLYKEYPNRNWFADSFTPRIGSPDAYRVGTPSTGGLNTYYTISPKYSRSMFVGGSADYTYYYRRDCRKFQQCIDKVIPFQNCAGATEAFVTCLSNLCNRPPAGVLCLPVNKSSKTQMGVTANDTYWSRVVFTDTDEDGYLMLLSVPP